MLCLRCVLRAKLESVVLPLSMGSAVLWAGCVPKVHDERESEAKLPVL
jgi:hypothetical protein